MKCVLYIYKIILHILLVSIPTKFIAALLFPVIYILKQKYNIWRLPNVKTPWNIVLVKQHNKGIKFLIWLFLDDAVYQDEHKDWAKYGVPKLFWNNNFLASYHWNVFRNTANNFAHYISKGYMVSIKHICFFNKKDRIILYQFSRKKNKIYPLIKIYFLDNTYRFQCGWIESGKFVGPSVRCKKNK